MQVCDRQVVSLKPDKPEPNVMIEPDSAESITFEESTTVWKSGVKVTLDMHYSTNTFHE